MTQTVFKRPSFITIQRQGIYQTCYAKVDGLEFRGTDNHICIKFYNFVYGNVEAKCRVLIVSKQSSVISRCIYIHIYVKVEQGNV